MKLIRFENGSCKVADTYQKAVKLLKRAYPIAVWHYSDATGAFKAWRCAEEAHEQVEPCAIWPG